MKFGKGNGFYQEDEIWDHHGGCYQGQYTYIGTLLEKIRSGDTKWFRLQKLNKQQIKYSETYYPKFYDEIKRILTTLKIEIRNSLLINSIIQLAAQFYKKLSKGSRIRNVTILTPISIYIICKAYFIFIPISEIKKIMNCNRSKFNLCFRTFFKLFPEYNKIFCSELFRLDYIRSVLLALKNHFDYPNKYLEISNDLLDKYYYKFSNKKDCVIAGFISVMTRKALDNKLNGFLYHECHFLGIKMSVLNNNEKLWNLKEGET